MHEAVGRGDSAGGGREAGRGDLAALDASMGRGRGRGLSNLPAWMTKGAGAVKGGSPEGLQVCLACLASGKEVAGRSLVRLALSVSYMQ